MGTVGELVLSEHQLGKQDHQATLNFVSKQHSTTTGNMSGGGSGNTNAPARPPKARRPNPPTDWPNSKPCTTTPPTANERLRTTSTLSKKKLKSWRTKPRQLKTKPHVPWLRLPA